MRPVHRPGPRSKTRQSRAKKVSTPDLGEVTTSEEDNSTFRSPPRDEDVTDYGLNFTSSPQRSTRASSLRTPTQATRQIVARASRQETTASQAPRRTRKNKFPARRGLIRLLNRTDFMIPRAAFGRVVREIMMDLESEVAQITLGALGALQTATEKYMENRFEDAYLLALHARRVTLMVRDLELIKCLLGRYCL